MADKAFITQVGSTGKPYEARLKTSAGYVDLTGSTLSFYMWQKDALVNKIDGASATVNPVQTGTNKGNFSYTFTTNDLDTPGDWRVAVKADIPGVGVVWFPTKENQVTYNRVVIYDNAEKP